MLEIPIQLFKKEGWLDMNNDELILQMYKIYNDHKEKFVDRSFQTNKFYLVMVFSIILTMLLTRDYSFIFGLSSILVFSWVGIAICILWWINVDSYNFLIKVKLSKVIEEIESQMPAQPFTKEFSIIKDLRKKQKEFLFADIQKGLATLSMLLFIFLFLYEVFAVII